MGVNFALVVEVDEIRFYFLYFWVCTCSWLTTVTFNGVLTSYIYQGLKDVLIEYIEPFKVKNLQPPLG